MDVKRMLGEKRFYLAILLAFAGILAGASWPENGGANILESGTFFKLTEDALQSQTVLFLLPVTAVLPCGEEYLRERQGNFLRFLLVRRGRREYCRDKVMTSALSGAVVWGIAALMGTAFFFLLFFGREKVWSGQWDLALPLARRLGRVCLTASALSSLSAALGALSGSVYLALGLPFVLFYACMILRERYLETLYCIDPAEWIRGENDWGSDGRGLWIFLILLALFLAVVHYAVLERRLEEV